MKLSPKEINFILNTDASLYSDNDIAYLSVDSRSLVDPASTLFISLVGNRQNGSQYIPDVIKKGVRNILVQKGSIRIEEFQGINFFEVENVLDSLQKLIKRKRKEITIPVIGITGSNGKTIIKEWLFYLLSQSYRVVKNPKSYNSQIGVPLSLWNLEQDYHYGIFEAGISTKDEMTKLEEMISPRIGIITNLGDAHQKNFKSYEEKLAEKLKLFYHSEVLLLKKDLFQSYPDQFLQLESRNSNIRLFTWGKEDADVLIHFDNTESLLILSYGNKKYSIPVKQKDPIYLENVSHCLSLILYLGFNLSDYVERISKLEHVEMRLEKIEGLHGMTLINDTYNADKDSFIIAIEFLKTQLGEKKSLILSEIENISIAELTGWLSHYQWETIVCIGEHFLQERFLLNAIEVKNLFIFQTTDEFLKDFSAQKMSDQVVLVKGSRKFQFEEIISKYRKKNHSTHLRVHLNAIKHNLNIFSKLLNPNTRMMVMLKAQAYGLGSVEIAKLLESQHIHYIAVAYVDEGIELRKAGITLPIMILNADIDSVGQLMEYHLEPEVYSLNFLRKLIQKIEERSIVSEVLKVHLKLETGMHRLGVENENLEEVLSILKSQKTVHIQSILSHLAASDELEHADFTRDQISRFKEMCSTIEHTLGYQTIKHILNTGGILHHSEHQMDMVRLGIGLFGFDSSNRIQSQLQPTLSLLSKISQIKKVKKEETIGYMRNGRLKRGSTIAIVNIGYADGYLRKFGCGNAQVFIHGKLYPTIGNICMDMIMVDITDSENIAEGDEVELYGRHITISDMARIAETIPYEIITSISNRVQRLYYED